MKKCIACTVLLSLLLTACTVGADAPTTTEPQMNVSTTGTVTTLPPTTTLPATTTVIPTTTVPPTSCTPTTVPVTSCKPTTVPTTKPTTATTTTPPSTTSVVPSSGSPTQATVCIGSQTVIPVSGMRYLDDYSESTGGWMCAMGSGLNLYSYSDYPSIQLTGPVSIIPPSGGALSKVYVKAEQAEKYTQTTISELSSLQPGVYYVKFATVRYGGTYGGRREKATYDNAFKLIVPGTPVSTTAPNTTKSTKEMASTTTNIYTTCGLLPCYGGNHVYENGHCIYCRSAER